METKNGNIPPPDSCGVNYIKDGGGFTWKSMRQFCCGSCLPGSGDDNRSDSYSTENLHIGNVRYVLPNEINSTTYMSGERADSDHFESESFIKRLKRCFRKAKIVPDISLGRLGLDGEHRVIHINDNQTMKFPSNLTKTAKYSIWSFLPLFLYEQFRRYSNLFFLFTAILQQIPDVSPTGRYITIFPLLFILAVSAIKEIAEDRRRHNDDKEMNGRKVEHLSGTVWKIIKWSDVSVGDIVKVTNNKAFPADLVLLASSKKQGICFIETMNLDGENNLKLKQAVEETSHYTEVEAIAKLKGIIECEPPNRRLYEFLAVLKLNGKEIIPLNPSQLLQRGAVLSNTDWICGIVVYSGHDTKLMRNSARAPLKNSTVERLMNKQIITLFIFYLILVITSAIMHVLWKYKNYRKHTYISGDKSFSIKDSILSFLTFLVLYNNLIPISLQVTLEMVRYFQAKFINYDESMYHAPTNTYAMARTSNLNEELGTVQYILTDKTGTLTCNVMEFKMCSIAGIIYDIENAPNESQLVRNLRDGHPTAKIIEEFMLAITLCHSVLTEEKEEGNIVYHSTNPDDEAIIRGAKKFDYEYVRRYGDIIEIRILGEIQKYQILQEIEFSSERKRMSVLVRMPNGDIKLFCKGADSVILERLANIEELPYYEATKEHLNMLAASGYRTLCCSVANISEEQYENWLASYRVASVSLNNRSNNLERVADLIERDLILLGITAIEDKLQEGVIDTIQTILSANIRIWMLTGDKQETAINIGFSSGLLHHKLRLILLNESSVGKTYSTIHSHMMNAHNLNNVGLVIDGKTLQFALSIKVRQIFNELCMGCRVVICCRLSPLQKGDITELVNSNNVCTLAIGDGANDVVMIRKARVGVGISGTEGRQAACSSDYAIAQFRYLKYLLFVHGTLNFRRITTLILYAFYKNICMSIIQMWYCIYTGWSAQILYESWSIAGYNVFFTSWPPLAIGIFDKVCSIKLLIKFPNIYRRAHDSKLFNVGIFWVWIFNAIIHSYILFWVPQSLLSNIDTIWYHGRSSDMIVLGKIIYTSVVITVCGKAALSMHSWTIFTHIAIWGSIILWFLWIIIYSYFWPTIKMGPEFCRLGEKLLSSPVFWILIILTPIIALVPDVIVKVFGNTYLQTITELARKIDHTHTKE